MSYKTKVELTFHEALRRRDMICVFEDDNEPIDYGFIMHFAGYFSKRSKRFISIGDEFSDGISSQGVVCRKITDESLTLDEIGYVLGTFQMSYLMGATLKQS